MLLFFTINSIKLLSQVSILSGGKDIKNSSGTVSFSVGEVFYISKGDKNTLSEGIQNGYTINPINNGSRMRVSIYPNPSFDLVYFKVENLNYRDLSYKLFSITGLLLRSGIILNIQSSISLNSLPSGAYLLKINRGLVEEKSFKILKQ